MFRYFHELNESNAFNYSNEIHTFFAYYISLKGTKKKGGYKRKHSNHELEDLKKYVATNLHKFLSNYTAIVPEERQTSEEEIRLIGELLNLSKLHPYAGNFDNSTIRNWITRR